MNAIRAQMRCGKGGQDESVGDVGLMEDMVENNHDSTMPATVPERLAARHRWHNQDLEIKLN